ncbi:CBO0543 family protein [Paenibacillus sp. TAB 01]|uniref:CBO0543 family protein n=1 Tax=Paenibacillus sp. TAB 01 TaxID=3368988 RepID=UPI0037513DC5
MLITIAVFNLIAFFMPKKLEKLELYATSAFALCLSLIVDIIFDLKYDWYGYFEKGVQIPFVIGVIGVYPAVNMIFLNFFPFHRSLTVKVCYILGCSLFAVGYEWFADAHSTFFYHNQWKLWHSAVTYPFLYLILLGNLKWVRRLGNKE